MNPDQTDTEQRRQALVEHLRGQFSSDLPARIGIAVSGGGDSVALMHLLQDCFCDAPVELMVATVDHGLRPEAHQEAVQVADMARDLGLSHTLLRWTEGPTKTGNLQDQARRARYGLLTGWARQNGIAKLALGHTADDQAETVLMRLMRASGVNGLAAMPRRRTQDGITLIRPLLGLRRAELRAYLRSRGQTWIEDPSNQDERFDRIKTRKALGALEDLGLTVEALSTVAQNMGKAQRALGWYAFLAARDMIQHEVGAIVIELRKFRALPDEISHRLMSQALLWISGSQYPPRRQPMIDAVALAQRGGSLTLSGCRILGHKGNIWICREGAAVQQATALPGQIWDQNWRVYAGKLKACEVRPLGEQGLKSCPDWRQIGCPAPVLEATPALWRGGDLMAAPLAGLSNGSRAEVVNSVEEFYASLLSH
ncbi:tRNA lysidine(34) synthetase TilS [Pseudophaeobacter flagellatus]|uniref:tRNA lysidine(34) synthetase TilS n=1 Tax=Pseudophaeobacter flagellatus TaxID=2899119 RepID=UPI001E4A3918|nr:tRNA lysidine(34) synthetase TilS [Pseudophaeobacter flagellatus]MCD9148404.1 tRNA lysidine(34) synthetase TilS [Pseudophaeobacter flagellatus]